MIYKQTKNYTKDNIITKHRCIKNKLLNKYKCIKW